MPVGEPAAVSKIAAITTQAQVGEPDTVDKIAAVRTRTPVIGKMTIGNGQFPLFDAERHSLSVFSSQV